MSPMYSGPTDKSGLSTPTSGTNSETISEYLDSDATDRKACRLKKSLFVITETNPQSKIEANLRLLQTALLDDYTLEDWEELYETLQKTQQTP